MSMLIVCDGGKRNNIAYGSWKLINLSGETVEHKQLIFGDVTSNTSEYLIMLSAIRRAKEIGIKEIVIFTDSQLVEKQVTNIWKCNYKQLSIIRDAIQNELKYFDKWEISKVSRNIIVSYLGH